MKADLIKIIRTNPRFSLSMSRAEIVESDGSDMDQKTDGSVVILLNIRYIDK